MPTVPWETIEGLEDYQKLSPAEKAIVKQGYWRDLEESEAFNSLTPEQRRTARDSFLSDIQYQPEIAGREETPSKFFGLIGGEKTLTPEDKAKAVVQLTPESPPSTRGVIGGSIGEALKAGQEAAKAGSFIGRDVWSELGKAVMGWPARTAKLPATALQYAGARMKGGFLEKHIPVWGSEYTLSDLGADWERLGKQANEYWQKAGKPYEQKKKYQGTVADKPELWGEPAWWAYNLGQMALDLGATAILPGMVASKIITQAGTAAKMAPHIVRNLAEVGAALIGGGIGTGLEATQTYQDVLEKTGNEKEAARAAEMMYGAVFALNAFSVKKILAKAGEGFLAKLAKTGGAAAVESITEGTEEPAEVSAKLVAKIITGQPLPKNIKDQYIDSLKRAVTVMGPAAVTGGGTAMLTEIGNNIEEIEKKAAPSFEKDTSKIDISGQFAQAKKELLATISAQLKSGELSPEDAMKIAEADQVKSLGITKKDIVNIIPEPLELKDVKRPPVPAKIKGKEEEVVYAKDITPEPRIKGLLGVPEGTPDWGPPKPGAPPAGQKALPEPIKKLPAPKKKALPPPSSKVGPEGPEQFGPTRGKGPLPPGEPIEMGILARGADPKAYTLKELKAQADQLGVVIPKNVIKKADVILRIQEGLKNAEKTGAAVKKTGKEKRSQGEEGGRLRVRISEKDRVEAKEGEEKVKPTPDMGPTPLQRVRGALYGKEGKFVEGEKEAQVHDYSSTQVNLPERETESIRVFAKKIPDSEIYEDPKDPSYGREDQPHITVKYGLDTVDPKEVEPLLTDQGPITAKLGKVSIFESDDYDVVKVDIESPELHALNKKIADNLKVTDTYPTYKPHATIAYVKKGEGAKYVGDKSFEGKKITFDSLVFSGKDGKETVIPLRGKASDAGVTPKLKEEKPLEAGLSLRKKAEGAPPPAQGESPRQAFIRGLTAMGSVRAGNVDYRILQTDDGGFYFEKVENGVRMQKGPGAPAKWSRATAIDKAMEDAEEFLATPGVELNKSLTKQEKETKLKVKESPKKAAEMSADELLAEWDRQAKQVEAQAETEPVPESTAPSSGGVSKPTAKQKAKEASQHIASAIDKFKQINKILGEEGALSDKEVDQAKWELIRPLLKEAWNDIVSAGKSGAEFVKLAMENLSLKGRPYFEKFVKEEIGGEKNAEGETGESSRMGVVGSESDVAADVSPGDNLGNVPEQQAGTIRRDQGSSGKRSGVQGRTGEEEQPGAGSDLGTGVELGSTERRGGEGPVTGVEGRGDKGLGGESAGKQEIHEEDQNHVIEKDDIIVPAGPEARIKGNIKAIQLVKKLQSENRNPTKTEKKILAKYVGWGAFSQKVFNRDFSTYVEKWMETDPPEQFFSPDNLKKFNTWKTKYGNKLHPKLGGLLTQEEWNSARASTCLLYTSPSPRDLSTSRMPSSA